MDGLPQQANNGSAPPCSEGFTSAPALARKAVRLFECAGQLLSRQTHYDFGMRALKTLLSAAGSALSPHRASPPQDVRASTGTAGAEYTEASAFMRAVHACVMPKLIAADAELFSALMSVRCSMKSMEVLYVLPLHCVLRCQHSTDAGQCVHVPVPCVLSPLSTFSCQSCSCIHRYSSTAMARGNGVC